MVACRGYKVDLLSPLIIQAGTHDRSCNDGAEYSELARHQVENDVQKKKKSFQKSLIKEYALNHMGIQIMI